jgi:hypothetical protein
MPPLSPEPPTPPPSPLPFNPCSQAYNISFTASYPAVVSKWQTLFNLDGLVASMSTGPKAVGASEFTAHGTVASRGADGTVHNFLTFYNIHNGSHHCSRSVYLTPTRVNEQFGLDTSAQTRGRRLQQHTSTDGTSSEGLFNHSTRWQNWGNSAQLRQGPSFGSWNVSTMSTIHFPVHADGTLGLPFIDGVELEEVPFPIAGTPTVLCKPVCLTESAPETLLVGGFTHSFTNFDGRIDSVDVEMIESAGGAEEVALSAPMASPPPPRPNRRRILFHE